MNLKINFLKKNLRFCGGLRFNFLYGSVFEYVEEFDDGIVSGGEFQNSSNLV